MWRRIAIEKKEQISAKTIIRRNKQQLEGIHKDSKLTGKKYREETAKKATEKPKRIKEASEKQQGRTYINKMESVQNEAP